MDDLRSLPITWLGYTAAFGAVHRRNYDALRAITCDAQEKDINGRTGPLIGQINPINAFWSSTRLVKSAASFMVHQAEGKSDDPELITRLLERGGYRFTPAQDFLFVRLRHLMGSLVLDDDEYAATFQRTELLLGLIGQDMHDALDWDRLKPIPAYGSFTWRTRGSQFAPEQQLVEEIREAAGGWPPLLSGLFGGEPARALAAAINYATGCQRVRFEQH